MNPIIFYHSADLDGKCSAAIVLRYEKQVWGRECELYGINYGDKFPWEKVEEKRLVYMVDFSLQPFEDMAKLSTLCDLVWIDHHKSAIEALVKHGPVPGASRCEIGKAGCELTWEYCSREPAPAAVRLLGRYDVWDEKCADPDWAGILEFQYGMHLENTEPTSGLWEDLFGASDDAIVRVVKHAGYSILRYEQKQYEIAMSALSFDTTLDGMRVLAANRGPTNSKLFESKWDPEKYDIMLSFYWSHRGEWKISLYTTKDDVDCSKIAQKYGGGGHAKAAGFQCQSLPFSGPDFAARNAIAAKG